MSNQTNLGRPATSELMMIAGVTVIIAGVGLLAAVGSALSAGDPDPTITLLLGTSGLTALCLGVFLVFGSTVVWRIDRIEQKIDRSTDAEDADIVTLSRKRI